MVIWNVNTSSLNNERINSISGDKLPSLDMNLKWNSRGDLRSKVYLKENQRLKYLNCLSTHARSIFRAIPKGNFCRLARFPSVSVKIRKTTVDALYPRHIHTLEVADLTPTPYPTMVHF